MLYSHFVLVERDDGKTSRLYVVYRRDPHFCIEVDPSYDPFGKIGDGFIKSMRISNSWKEDHLSSCISLSREAERFFRETALVKEQGRHNR